VFSDLYVFKCLSTLAKSFSFHLLQKYFARKIKEKEIYVLNYFDSPTKSFSDLTI